MILSHFPNGWRSLRVFRVFYLTRLISCAHDVHHSLIDGVMNEKALTRHWVSIAVTSVHFMARFDANNTLEFQRKCGTVLMWTDAGAVCHARTLYLPGASCSHSLQVVMRLVTYLKATGPDNGRTLGVRFSILSAKAPGAMRLLISKPDSTRQRDALEDPTGEETAASALRCHLDSFDFLKEKYGTIFGVAFQSQTERCAERTIVDTILELAACGLVSLAADFGIQLEDRVMVTDLTWLPTSIMTFVATIDATPASTTARSMTPRRVEMSPDGTPAASALGAASTTHILPMLPEIFTDHCET